MSLNIRFSLKAVAVLVSAGSALTTFALPSSAQGAAGCLSDAEIEAVIGPELKAGAFAVNTSKFGDRPLCSGLPIAQAIQNLRKKYFPETPSERSVPAEPASRVDRGSAASDGGSPALNRYVGKYNLDKVDGYTFSQHPVVVSALNKAGVPRLVRQEILKHEVSAPIRSTKGILISQGCFPHHCSEMHFKIYVNPRTGAGALCYFDTRASWYSTAGKPSSNASNAPCPEDPGATPQSIRQGLSTNGNDIKSAVAPTGSGRIWGEFSFPSDYIPGDITACAEEISSRRETCVKRNLVQGTSVFYSVEVPPGQYRVYARSADALGKRAYYSKAVVCGKGSGGMNGCNDHSPVVLTVTSGSVHSGVNPQDWYAN